MCIPSQEASARLPVRKASDLYNGSAQRLLKLFPLLPGTLGRPFQEEMKRGLHVPVLEGMKKDEIMPIVIMLSNYSGRQYRQKCLQSGARFFFDKSAEFHKVAEAVQVLRDAAALELGLVPGGS